MYLLPGAIALNSVSGSTKLSNNANELKCYQFVCPYGITISAYAVRIGTGVASTSGNIGLYSADGNTKLVDVNFSTVTSSAQLTGSFGSTALSAGTVYWLVCASASTSVSVTAQANVSLGGSGLATLINGNSVKSGTAANALSAGVLPATLGTISAWSGTPDTGIPYIVFE